MSRRISRREKPARRISVRSLRQTISPTGADRSAVSKLERAIKCGMLSGIGTDVLNIVKQVCEENKQLRVENRQILRENRHLYDENIHFCKQHAMNILKIKCLEDVVKEKDDKIKEKDDKIKELEGKLAQFDNSNTPSSAKPPGSKGKKRKSEQKKSTKKRGGQEGHKGDTNKPEPTVRAQHVPDKCANCNNKNLKLVKRNTRNITEMEITVITAKHEEFEGWCGICGTCTEPPAQPTSLQLITPDDEQQESTKVTDSSGNQNKESSEHVKTDEAATSGQHTTISPGQESSEHVKTNETATSSIPAKSDSEKKSSEHVKTDETAPVSPPVQDTHSDGIPDNVVRCVSRKIPKRGEFGLYVILLAIINYLNVVPFRRISRALMHMGVSISSATVHEIVSDTGWNLSSPTDDILRRIRNAYVLNVDETSISFNGKKVWIWIFHNPETGDTYIVVRPSRGKKVIEEVLGKNWKGWIVCDGWVAYKKYRKQRCWAHIITAIKHVVDRNPECGEAQEVLDALTEIYKIGCETEGSDEERRAVRALLDERVRKLVSKYADIPELQRFITKLSNARPNLFHFVIDTRIPPTNNAAERGLRVIVVHRKVRGSIRAEDTMTWMGNLFTCISTWTQKKMDILEEMAKYI